MEHPQVWGALIELLGDAAEDFRNFLIEHSAATPAAGYFMGSLYPMQLRLPHERRLLPHIAVLLIAARHDRIERHQSYESFMSEHVKLFVSNIDDLVAVMDDQRCEQAVRAAAAFLFNFSTGSFSEEDPHGWSLFASKGWQLQAAALMRERRIQRGEEHATRAFAQLLDEARADCSARVEVEPYMVRWREFSQAPVQSSPAAIWAAP
jgi:hypothetical protein